MKGKLQGRGKGNGGRKDLEKHVYLNYTFRGEINFGFILILLYEEKKQREQKSPVLHGNMQLTLPV